MTTFSCPKCKGKKLIRRDDNEGRKHPWIPCPVCNGQGEVSELQLRKYEEAEDGLD